MSPEYEYPKNEGKYEDWYTPRNFEIVCSTEKDPETETTKTDIGKVSALNYYGGKYSKYRRETGGEKNIENHDSLFIFEDDKYVYMSVIDGMGGYEAPESFSRELNQQLQDSFKQAKSSQLSVDSIYNMAQNKIANSFNKKGGAVATTTRINKETDESEIATLGDSRGAIISSSGEIKAASEIHNEKTNKFEALSDQDSMRLLSTEFFESIQKMGIYSESVFRCFNSNESKNFTPDVTKSALKSGDFLILGTDGVINEALTIPEIAEYIRANPNQNEEELREKIFKTMSRKIKQKHESEDKKIKTITKEGSEVELHTSFVSSDNMSLIVFKMD